MIAVDLPYPDKLLWPNGRTRSVHAKARQIKAHREWARWAVISQRESKTDYGDVRFNVQITVQPKPKGPLPDIDNVIAAAKSYLDGIAQELGVNDQAFNAPSVLFANPRNGRFLITLEVAQ